MEDVVVRTAPEIMIPVLEATQRCILKTFALINYEQSAPYVAIAGTGRVTIETYVN